MEIQGMGNMRAPLTRAATVMAVALVLAAGLSGCANPAGYTWQNVVIKGGGFVPGIVFNRTEKDLIYARTDIGGAYRWNPQTRRWIPLLDWVGPDDWGLTGVVSLASDAVDPNRVYVAGGTYTNDWDPKPGAILRSSDRGTTWQTTRLPFKLGGNMPGRGMGERLVVDPHDNRVLYLGAPGGNGLWRSTDQGVTWAKVTSFPNPGTYRDTPDDPNGYGGGLQGVVWVTFDERPAPAGQPTRTIYVGVADKQSSVYRSTDAGATWQAVPGQPTGYLPHKGVMDAAGNLFIATSTSAGPYGNPVGDKQDHGEVWRLDTASGAWTNISPVPVSSTADNYFGYSGLSVDRQHPGTVMVTGYSSWWPDTRIWRSADRGATWTQAYEVSSYPQRTFRYTQDVTAAPWLKTISNASDAEVTPRLGWMTESLEIDPFNSDRMMYGTGATIYGTDNLTAWDRGAQARIVPMVDGLEETSALDLISPPAGPPLISGLGDIGGFRHESLDAVPATTFTSPFITTTTSLDFAEQRPGFVVRVGNQSVNDAEAGMIGLSSDGGANWWAGGVPGGTTGGGSVAVAADGNRIVWSPAGIGVQASGGDANTWQPSSGIPAGAVVESDRVDAATFYGMSGGRFYRSTDGGRTFAATPAAGLPATARFKALTGTRGDVWVGGGTAGLWHSTDGGTTFTKQANVTEAANIGFGKAAPGQTYPALYSSALIGGVRGIFRSGDAGATWVRINDDRHQYAAEGAAITGDPRVYGRVYVATNGRGVIYGGKVG
jgi:xyloglucan-specific exo-beta-1,4-glucanase